VLRVGLRRLQELGAHTAYVTAVDHNDAARKLYESVGFTPYTREYAYKKALDGSGS
jgi:RimJ/RimL family protein N-acetyltransferase